jgi:hypothetical protein
MSEFCVSHMWFGGNDQPCPWCKQPADEPCPSSCGVDLAYFAPVGSNPPKADAVSDAAHMYWDAYGSPQSRQEREAYYSQHGLVLRTREEWECQRGELTVWRDKYDRVIDQLTDLRQGDMEAELATLRAQLDSTRTERNEAAWELEIAKSQIEQLQARIERMRPAFPGKSKAALLLQSNTDHRLGSGNVLEGKPEYQEPKPVIRTRPML